MDYIRFNYVAQPEDKDVSLLPGIGAYDEYAIGWGYQYIPQAKTPDDENKTLHHYITERASNPYFFYGKHTFNPVDPRSQGEDLGNDAMKAGMYGIATNGNWSMRVYEVDSVTGIRKVRSGDTAPTNPDIATSSGLNSPPAAAWPD